MFKLFSSCPQCQTSHFFSFLKKELYRCSQCGYLFRLSAQKRLAMLLDRGSFKPLPLPRIHNDPIFFPEYTKKLEDCRKRTGMKEAILAGTGRLDSIPVAIAAMDSRFMMASMGASVGETVCQLIDLAIKEGLPLILVICSGGARMQEGIVSLMQMAKTSAAVARLHARKLPYLAVLSDPTTGGVSASFAMLADVILAEKDSLIGFAGPRVIQQTIGPSLPDGMIDRVVERSEIKPLLRSLLKIHSSRPYPVKQEIQ